MTDTPTSKQISMPAVVALVLAIAGALLAPVAHGMHPIALALALAGAVIDARRAGAGGWILGWIAAGVGVATGVFIAVAALS
jgi:hypothetical protein